MEKLSKPGSCAIDAKPGVPAVPAEKRLRAGLREGEERQALSQSTLCRTGSHGNNWQRLRGSGAKQPRQLQHRADHARLAVDLARDGVE
jgi:hypothetical protein